MFGIEWRNFKKHLTPKSYDDQGRINKKLTEYIYYLYTETRRLNNEVKRLQKGKEESNAQEGEVTADV